MHETYRYKQVRNGYTTNLQRGNPRMAALNQSCCLGVADGDTTKSKTIIWGF